MHWQALPHSMGPGVIVPKMEKNLYLTGLMGAGKTTVGKLLASNLGIDLYDTDEIIAATEGMSINEIFSSRGESFFRNKETEILQLLGEKSPGTCVVSTGGGAVVRDENRAAMRKNGLIVFLEVTAEEALKRLSISSDRPLLNVQDREKSLKHLLQKRDPCYREADVAVQTTGKPAEEIVEVIMRAVKEWRKNEQ